MTGGWIVRDMRPVGLLHVMPCDDADRPLPTHVARPDCQCRPVLLRDGPLDEPIVNHREPTHPGAGTRLDA